jgi:hypothetical protein
LWHETRYLACKTALNWITIRKGRMTRRKATERLEKVSNCEVTPHATWPIAKFLMKRDRSKAPTTIHGPSGLKFLPLEKDNAILYSLENQFTPHDLCEENHERRA